MNDTALDAMREAAKANLVRHYKEGLKDGTVATLRILLGRPEHDSVAPAPQEHVGPELRAWAEDVLARAEERDQ